MAERTRSRSDGYSRLSVIVHWMAAILVIALFFTHEGARGTAAYAFHVSGGAVVGLLLLWRVWRRIRRGAAAPPEQAAIFNFLAGAVHWSLLVLIVVVVVSGYLLPWSLGRPLDVFGFGIPSPMDGSRALHEIVERTHDVAGHLFIPLVVLHVAGALKHAILFRRGSALRMLRPIDGGR